MKTILKLLAALVSLVLLVLAGIAVWATWFFELDQYRDDIQGMIARETGLEIELRGPIEHHLLNGLHISITDIQARKGEQTVLAVDELSAQVSLYPLLDRELVIPQVTLKTQTLNLAIDKDGNLNLLAGKKGNSETPADTGSTANLPLQRIEIGEVLLEVQQARYLDAREKLDIQLQGLSASLNPLPILEQNELLVDDPSWLMGYSQSGKLQIKSLSINGLRIQNLTTEFSNSKGALSLQHIALDLQDGKAGTDGHTKLQADGSLQLRLHYDEPLNMLHQTPWNSLDAAHLEGLVLDLKTLELNTADGRISLKQTHLEADAFPLIAKGKPMGELLQQQPLALIKELPLRIKATGSELRMPGTAIKDFVMVLTNKDGKLHADLTRAKLHIQNQAADAPLQDLQAGLSGKIRLSAHAGKKSTGKKKDRNMQRLQLDTLKLDISGIQAKTPQGDYRAAGLTLQASEIPLIVKGKALQWDTPAHWASATKGMKLTLLGKNLQHGEQTIESLKLGLSRVDNKLVIKEAKAQLGRTQLRARGDIDLIARPAPWTLSLESEQVSLSHLLAFAEGEFNAEGMLAIDLDLSGTGVKPEHLRNNLNGQVLMDGQDLKIEGADLDAVLTHLEKSQSVGLLDVGAYALAGPAGALLTKGSDYSQLVSSAKQGGTSRITHMRSQLRIAKSMVHTEDVAVATSRHRLAVKGTVSTKEKGSIALQIATVDAKGCAKYMEQIGGTNTNPQVNQAGAVVKGVINPITSLLGKVAQTISTGCDKPFYAGKVPAPKVTSEAGGLSLPLLKGTRDVQ